ncbi:unnamed protein product, partial [Amoebophrya sp. A120]
HRWIRHILTRALQGCSESNLLHFTRFFSIGQPEEPFRH